MSELNEAKMHQMPKGSIIDWYGECKAANIPYGFVPCGWFGKGLGTLQEIASEVAAWEAKYPNNITITRTYTSGSRISISKCNGQVVPALTDRFVVQAGHSYSLGDNGGENFHTLTINEMPSHAHKLVVCRNEYGGIDTGGCDAGNNNSDHETAWKIPSRQVDGSDQAYTGGDESHENRPPYYALYKLIKVI